MPKLLISDKLSTAAVDFLKKEKGFDVVVDTGKTEDELVQIIADCDVILVRSATKVTRKIIEAGKNLKLIGRAGSGVDNIDLTAASEKGILVINAPFGNLVSVAELVFAHFLNLARKITEGHTKMVAGVWAKKEVTKTAREIDGKTLGIVGLGKIGQLVAARAKAFNLKILAYDPVVTPEVAHEHGAELVSLDELLKNSDLVTIHVPLIPSTKHLIGTAQLKIMKPSVFLVHCARGGVVDDAALLQALSEGTIAGAGLDVFEKEPVTVENPFLKLANVSLSPHIGGDTIEGQDKVGLELVRQIARALKGEMVEHIVNFPFKPKTPFANQGAFITLAEKLGSFLGQYIVGRKFEEVVITTEGALTRADTRVLTVAVAKGLLGTFSESGEANLLNALDLAEKKGLKVREEKNERALDYPASLSVKVICDGQKVLGRGAVINDLPQVVFLDGLKLNFTPEGFLLISEHKDLPGALATVANVLAQKNINIAGMQLGREGAGGRAIMALNVDAEVPEQVLKDLNGKENFVRVRMIKL